MGKCGGKKKGGGGRCKAILFALAFAAAFAGCRVVEVENRGEGIVTDKDGNPVLVNGAVQKYTKGWNVYHNQHWMVTEADSLTAHVGDGQIDFALNGLNSRPDGTNLVALVETSFNGVNTLAAKIIAACVTSGGSTAGEAAVIIGKELYTKFVSAGGDTSKATVTTGTDGKVTVTDGTVSVSGTCTDGSCTTCTDGSCSPSTSTTN